ncbi:homeodomain-like protein [Tanacetum coccineum]
MGEPAMEEYMTKTQEDYGSGIAKPKFDEKAHFELKGFYQEITRNPLLSRAKKTLEESLRKFMAGIALENDENYNMIKEFQAIMCRSIRNQGASIKALEIQIREKEGNEQSLGELAPTKFIIELADRTIKLPKGIAEHALAEIDKFIFSVDFIVLDMPEDIKVPGILGRPFLSTAHAKIDVFKRKITLRRMELDLEVRLMGEALILNRSLDLTYEDYIELNDLNEPLDLRRNQVEDSGLTIEECEVIDIPMEDIVKTRNDDNEISNGIDEYPSFCDFDRKIHINCAYNLQFSCMIGFEHVNANFFLILSINVMSKRFYNSIMKDKIEYKEKNVVGAFINVPIFIGNFSVMTDFAVVENMDAYRDEGMGDVIVGKPFCREVCVKARRFDGMITIYNGNGSVTYQMVRSYPRFKHLTNAQCNKMRPLLKVSARDELNGISHPYQKLKSFYKGVLNLGPEYTRDAKIK